MESSHGLTRPDRKTVEKNRRIQMKALCSKLESLLPSSPNSREGVTLPLPDRLDEAVNYIKGLQGRLERMKERKRQLMGSERRSRGMGSEVGGGMRVPQIEVQDLGPALRVVLISSPVDRLLFYEAIRVLEEEGGAVLNANFSVVGDNAFHIIHSMVADPRGGSEATKVLERLKMACSQ
ncbi:transcription factor bHLH162 [Elaeis guineensis]|uniref:Transcription factor bHLH162 n=1 Tax=Elaeis guineensis var. tenera TaxID=51953 RepID=A0A6I9RMW9_ELAGV|nr:transcription factor bHLH162 [Elaeis guineensis]